MKNKLGYSRTEGVSMLYLISPGDMLIYDKEKKRIDYGDIAVYIGAVGRKVAHRCYFHLLGCYVFCGDNCLKFEKVMAKQIIGKVVAIKKKGIKKPVDLLNKKINTRYTNFMLRFIICIRMINKIIRIQRPIILKRYAMRIKRKLYRQRKHEQVSSFIQQAL